jgi:drug/metabolite transporter (DMT)-like permease
LGLASAAAWGGSDFAGGVGARRAPALLVVVSGQIVSLLVLLSVCLGMRLAVPGAHSLLYAAVGGFEGALALAAFYRALAMGAMGLTAALSGLLTALVPVLFTFFHDGLPNLLTAVGLAMGLAAIWLITREPSREGKRSTTPPAALLLGLLSGIGFGTQLILLKLASIQMPGAQMASAHTTNVGAMLWIMTSARAAGVAAMLLVLSAMPHKAPWRGFWFTGFWFTGILAGTLDTVGNLFYLQAARIGRLDVAALVCSLYPAVTILLAALVLHERPTRRQLAGMALALAAVGLLSL